MTAKKALLFLLCILLVVGGFLVWANRGSAPLERTGSVIHIYRDSASHDLSQKDSSIYQIPASAPVWDALWDHLEALKFRHTLDTSPAGTGNPQFQIAMEKDSGTGRWLLVLSPEAPLVYLLENLKVTNWGGMSREAWFQKLDTILSQCEPYLMQAVAAG